MTHKRYLVLGGPSGKRRYRDHDPGDTFEAQLDPDAERRAIERGSIRVLEVIQPELQNGSYALPDDWPRPAADAPPIGAAESVSRTNEGG